MTVDVSKLRNGDKLTLSAEFCGHGAIRFFRADGSVIDVLEAERFADAIVSVEPRPLKVGDRVFFNGVKRPFDIRFIEDDIALIRDGIDSFAAPLSRLSPA